MYRGRRVRGTQLLHIVVQRRAVLPLLAAAPKGTERQGLRKELAAGMLVSYGVLLHLLSKALSLTEEGLTAG